MDNLELKAAEYIKNALGKALPNSAIDFGLILSIITTLAPIITGCFDRRVRRSIQQGDDAFFVNAFNAGVKNGLSPAESVAFAAELKDEVSDSTVEEIDEFIQLCQETT